MAELGDFPPKLSINQILGSAIIALREVRWSRPELAFERAETLCIPLEIERHAYDAFAGDGSSVRGRGLHVSNLSDRLYVPTT